MGSLCFHTGKVETAVNSTICGLVPELRPTPDLRQLPDPFYANDVTVWNLAPALPFARYTRHVLVTVNFKTARRRPISPDLLARDSSFDFPAPGGGRQPRRS